MIEKIFFLLNGIYWSEKWNSWIANATIGNEKIFLGSYESEIDAKEQVEKWQKVRLRLMVIIFNLMVFRT